MKDAYYFSHDGNARHDPKMLMLRAKYKNNGYACFFMILEIMREAHNYKLEKTDYLYNGIAIDLSEHIEYIQDFFCHCFAIGLLQQDEKYIWSESFLRRMERKENLSKTRRDAGIIGSMKRWQTDSKPYGKPIAVKESKVKERKERVHRTAFAVPTIQEVTSYCKERGNGVIPSKWMAHYEANGWKVGKNPMKDWKAAVRTWEHSEYNQTTPQAQKRPITAPSNAYNQAREDADKQYIEHSEAWHKAFYKDGCPGCGYKPKNDLDICNCATYKAELEKAIKGFKP